MSTVHLLLHDLDGDRTPDDELDALLNDQERGRGARFVHPLHRRRFRVGRAMLRRTLARWTGVSPEKVAFQYGPKGKPAMRGGPAFNVSHSEGTLLIGLAERGRLGVDIELLRSISDRMVLASANFASDEVRALEAVPPDNQDEQFMLIWTCKEALIKAAGGGLSVPLQSFCVMPGRSNALAIAECDAFSATDWTIRSLQKIGASPAAVAAVAIDAPECEVVWS